MLSVYSSKNFVQSSFNVFSRKPFKLSSMNFQRTQNNFSRHVSNNSSRKSLKGSPVHSFKISSRNQSTDLSRNFPRFYFKAILKIPTRNMKKKLQLFFQISQRFPQVFFWRFSQVFFPVKLIMICTCIFSKIFQNFSQGFSQKLLHELSWTGWRCIQEFLQELHCKFFQGFPEEFFQIFFLEIHTRTPLQKEILSRMFSMTSLRFFLQICFFLIFQGFLWKLFCRSY